MFGFFMICLAIICYFGKLISDYRSERYKRKRAIEKGNDFYVDRNGFRIKISPDGDYPSEITRDVHYVAGKGIVEGDVVERNPYTGRVIRNLSQEKRNKETKQHEASRAAAIKNGEKYYIYNKCPLEYCDVDTGDVFVITSHREGQLMWNVNTEKYERIVDEEKLPQINRDYLKLLMESENSTSTTAYVMRQKLKGFYTNEMTGNYYGTPSEFQIEYVRQCLKKNKERS